MRNGRRCSTATRSTARASGVRRYTLTRPVDAQQTVVGELEFDGLSEAETFAGRLREVWKGLGSNVIADAGLRITEVLERKQFVSETARRAA